MSTIGERIKERRKSQQMNQHDLSQRTGISQAQISRYENGENEPTGDALIALADTLDITTDWLLGRSDALVTVREQSGLDQDERQLIELLRTTDRQMRHKVIKAIRALLE
jgi:transcriptional regulator with XRE-family HTH domain